MPAYKDWNPFIVASSGTVQVGATQRPGIGQTVERDLDIMARLARMLDRGTRWGVPSGCATWPTASPRRSARSWTSASRPTTWRGWRHAATTIRCNCRP
ncbi:MAG TPA: hypothetical protein VFA45_12390, partial [Actinomycetes bacterium]|nr:hypothetical protein [Actinomycetes bacterium]